MKILHFSFLFHPDNTYDTETHSNGLPETILMTPSNVHQLHFLGQNEKRSNRNKFLINHTADAQC